jgi:hypothetical protein
MGFFIMNGKQYQVICQADRQFRDEPIDLSTIYIRNREGDLIQLDNVVNIEYGSTCHSSTAITATFRLLFLPLLRPDILKQASRQCRTLLMKYLTIPSPPV